MIIGNYIGLGRRSGAVPYWATASQIAGWTFETDSHYCGNLSGDIADQIYNGYNAQYFNGKTYVSYLGYEDDPYITYYDHDTGLWASSVKVGTNPLANFNEHSAPGLFIDATGYIHMMYGAHTTALQYAKSTNSEDISLWTAMSSPAATASYYQLMQFSDGKLYLFYRKTAPSQGTTDWGYITSTNGGTSWSAHTTVFEHFAYCKFKKGIGDTVHVAITGLDTTGYDRMNIYYAFYNSTNWKNGDGTNLSLPIDSTSTGIKIYDSGTNAIPSVIPDYDLNNVPCLLFSEGLAQLVATFDYKFTRYNGSSWTFANLGVAGDSFGDNSVALDVITENTIDAYVLTGGTTDAIGGNVELWKSSNKGITWSKVKTLATGQFIQINKVNNYNTNGRIFFPEYLANSFKAKGYLWGANGFVKGRVLSVGASPLVARMVTAGETPTVARGELIDYTITSLIISGLWTKFDAIWSMASHGPLSSRFNWKGTSYTLTDGADAPTFTIDRGIAGDGDSQYLKTGIVPSGGGLNYVRDSACLGVYTRTGTKRDIDKMIGAYGASVVGRAEITRMNVAGTIAMYVHATGAGWTSFVNGAVSGLMMVVRNSSSSISGYRDKTAANNTSSTSDGLPPEIYILANDNNGTAAAFSSAELSLAFIGSKLTPTEQGVFYDIMVDGWLAGVGAKV